MKLDLHVHSTDSFDAHNGYSPTKLIEKIKSEGKINGFSITDHDFVNRYYKETDCLARSNGLFYVVGGEIDSYAEIGGTVHRGIHVLVYFNPSRVPEGIFELVDSIAQERKTLCGGLIKKLVDMGVLKPSVLRAQEYEEHLVSNRMQIASMLTSKICTYKSYVSPDLESALEFLRQEIFQEFRRKGINARDLCQRVREWGGVTSLAHPFRVSSSRKDVNLSFISELIDNILPDGVECFYPYHNMIISISEEESTRLRKNLFDLVNSKIYDGGRRLLITGGSDFHGDDDSSHGKTPPGEVFMSRKSSRRFLRKLNG